jgi:hypothetical protein
MRSEKRQGIPPCQKQVVSYVKPGDAVDGQLKAQLGSLHACDRRRDIGMDSCVARLDSSILLDNSGMAFLHI